MYLSLTEAIERVRNWERKGTKLYGLILPSDSSPLAIKFSGYLSLHEQVFIMAGEDGQFELTLALEPTMTFSYHDALLEIRSLPWRFVIFENKPDYNFTPDYNLRLVPDRLEN